jgi:hypothetical protein
MANINPFTGNLDFTPSPSFVIKEDGTLPNGNKIAEIQNGELKNVSEIDAGDYNPEP